MMDLKAWGDMNCDNADDADVCIMGVPFDSAVFINKGAAMAPEILRGFSRYLPHTTEVGEWFSGLKVYDAGDVEIDLNWDRFFGTVEEEAFNLLDKEKFCIFLGGDHSVTIPLHRAFGRATKGQKIGIVHFDSHSDICDEFEGHKWSHACTEMRAVQDVLESPSDLALVGIRSFEPDEVEYLNTSSVKLITAYDLFDKGHKAICEELYDHFKGYDAIYFTLDIDVVDPAGAPGTGTPEAGGPSSRVVMELVKFMIENLPIKAMDIVEVSPPLDTRNQITSWTALKIIYEVFGKLYKKLK